MWGSSNLETCIDVSKNLASKNLKEGGLVYQSWCIHMVLKESDVLDWRPAFFTKKEGTTVLAWLLHGCSILWSEWLHYSGNARFQLPTPLNQWVLFLQVLQPWRYMPHNLQGWDKQSPCRNSWIPKLLVPWHRNPTVETTEGKNKWIFFLLQKNPHVTTGFHTHQFLCFLNLRTCFSVPFHK